jgi:hypothetical protein
MYKSLAISMLLALVIACGGDSDSVLDSSRVDGNVTAVDPQSGRPGEVSLQPDLGANHIPIGGKFSGYATSPATSGFHWGGTAPTPDAPFGAPVRWGAYTTEISDEALVHNLEHGGIGLHYNCPEGCAETVAQLIGMATAGFPQFVISPYSNMESRVAVTAWRRILFLDEFDETAIRGFIDAYRDRAPESVPGNMF